VDASPGHADSQEQGAECQDAHLLPQLEGFEGTTFNHTRSIIGAKFNIGKLTLHLQGGDPWEGNRELEFRVMTNDRPEQTVANYLRLVVRFGGE